MEISEYISETRKEAFIQTKHSLDTLREMMQNVQINDKLLREAGIQNVLASGQIKSLYEIIALPNIDITEISKIAPTIIDYNQNIVNKLRIESLYHNYNKRFTHDINLLKHENTQTIPESLNFDAIQSLSNEMREKLRAHKPRTIADIKAIPCITPTAFIAIRIYLKKNYGF